jgi:K+-transporting ATPase ATPase A chain
MSFPSPQSLVATLGCLLVVVALAKPLGAVMARIYAGESPFLRRIERWCLRPLGVDSDHEQTWLAYAKSLVLFNGAGFLLLYALQRWQHVLPGNPQQLGPVAPDSAFNTAISFATNTNWQGYAGETTMSLLVQMAGLGVQNFLSAATGMAVFAAIVRGLARTSSKTIGSFWVDTFRSTAFILLPLSLVFALALAADGVVQTMRPAVETTLVDASLGEVGDPGTRSIPLGPVASQVAIKQLGTNGGGFFNANSAHPLENPTPLTNALQVIAILLIPAALCCTYGALVRDRRQGWMLLCTMLAILLVVLAVTAAAESTPNPAFAGLPLDQSAGNMEGKETRFGLASSVLWAVATTAASNGSVNSMHDSFSPLGGLGPMWLMQLGEVVFGGVGSGLYGMLLFVFIAVFVAGLMVGRTPEYLGKKIEPFEMKMASLGVLMPSAFVLVGTALAVSLDVGRSSMSNPGPHGFSQVLYAFSSASNNNGSAFAGLSANTPFYNAALGVCMFVGRVGVAIPVLAIAGSLAMKGRVPTSAGTLPTHTPLFAVLLASVVLIVGALGFLPALALGPVLEHVRLHSPTTEVLP